MGAVIVSCKKDEDDDPEPDPTPTPSIDADVTFEVSNAGAAAYVFEFTDVQNPELELTRGKTYEFAVNSPGHPFLLKTVNATGTDNTYDDGVTNNGAASGSVVFTVPDDAPDVLWYVCEFHASMIGRIRIVDEGATRAFTVGNNGPSAYTFSGSGLTDVENPNFTFKRGETYTFEVSTPGHPFLIKTVQSTGSGNAYNDGVTGNGLAEGTITFEVPENAPNTLFYVCEIHGPMTGTISVMD